MLDLDHYLAGCDALLAEADLLVGRLASSSDVTASEIASIRGKMARLRSEVDRLRGMKIIQDRKAHDPKRSFFLDSELPWPVGRRPETD